SEAITAVAAADSPDEPKQVRIAHAGDRSPLARANRQIGSLPVAERQQAGMRVGEARSEVAAALAERAEVLQAEHEERMLATETVDVTLDTYREPYGARHPLATIQDRISDVFVAMGWEVGEGPEVEAEWLNFDALNLGPDHPARTMQDTFWVAPATSGMV